MVEDDPDVRDYTVEMVIPSPINQNRCAQSRNPIDIMVQG